VKTVTPEAMTALVHYAWPGNVRELEHAIERAVILARTTAIRPEDLPTDVTTEVATVTAPSDLNLDATERAFVAKALRRFGGNRKRGRQGPGCQHRHVVAHGQASRSPRGPGLTAASARASAWLSANRARSQAADHGQQFDRLDRLRHVHVEAAG